MPLCPHTGALSDSSRRSAPVHRGSRGALLPQDFWKESREWWDRAARPAAVVPAFLGGCPVSAPGTDRSRKPFRPETWTWTRTSPILGPSLPLPLLTVFCTAWVPPLLKFKNLRHLNTNFTIEKDHLPLKHTQEGAGERGRGRERERGWIRPTRFNQVWHPWKLSCGCHPPTLIRLYYWRERSGCKECHLWKRNSHGPVTLELVQLNLHFQGAMRVPGSPMIAFKPDPLTPGLAAPWQFPKHDLTPRKTWL